MNIKKLLRKRIQEIRKSLWMTQEKVAESMSDATENVEVTKYGEPIVPEFEMLFDFIPSLKIITDYYNTIHIILQIVYWNLLFVYN